MPCVWPCRGNGGQRVAKEARPGEALLWRDVGLRYRAAPATALPINTFGHLPVGDGQVDAFSLLRSLAPGGCSPSPVSFLECVWGQIGPALGQGHPGAWNSE